jgi:cyclophilin family peptidyl-prolyl cis-trans isomerase
VSKAAKRERQRQNREARREIEEQLAKRSRRMRSVRNFAILLTPFIIIFIVISLTNGGGGSSNSSKNSAAAAFATLTTSKGDIVVQLSTKEAPQSEAQFVRLAKKGFYNGLSIFRVSSSTGIIQTGDPKNDGTGNSGHTVPDQYPKTAYKLGDLAFANAGPKTSDSQFFIVTGDAGTKLPLNYNRFGKVISGLDVAQAIQALSPASGDGAPTTPVTLVSVTISTKNPLTSGTTTTTAGSTATTAAPTTTSAR